jgi:homocysteine S-methyltransferase
VHYDYFVAGADLATTASYQASFEGFARRGIGTEAAAALVRDSVALARAARDEFWSDPARRAGRLHPLIAASVGPYGAALADGSEYRGGYSLSDAELNEFHRPRLSVLVDSGADLLACETLPSLREALLLARLLQQHPTVCAWISFSCKDGEHTCEGQPIEECVRALDGFVQVAGIGINCTRPAYVRSLLERMRAHTAKPLLAYPNSGEDYDAQAKRWSGRGDFGGDGGGATLSERARDWYAAGARLIGGCCRTRPEDIHMIRESLLQCA